jgi:DNA modification methylase
MMIVEQMLNNAPKPLLHIADVSGSALFQGDCLDIMPLIPDNSIDMVFTDLPYGQTQCKWDTPINLELFWKQINRITKENCAVLLTATEPFASALRMSNIKNYKYDFVWKKNKPSGALNANKMPMQNHEMILVFYRKQPTFNKILEPRECNEASKKRLEYKMTGFGGSNTYGSTKTEKYKYDPSLRNPTSVREFELVPNPLRVHPTEKPISLMEYMITTFSNENDIVADFTMGVGSTCTASKNLNRKFIGIEKEPKYYEIACQRCGF